MKYVLLTGVSGGIGQATAKKILDNDYFVIGLDINEPSFTHPHFKFIKCDLTKDDELLQCQNKIEHITNNIYAIYFLSGIFLMQSMIEGNENDLRKIIEINFWSNYKLVKLLFPYLKENARIIIFSSEVARYSPHPFDGYYTLSKLIVDKYGDILRRELAYQKIKVIKVQCGAIKTDLLTGVNKKYDDMVANSILYKKPLTKLKKLMDNEITKQKSPKKVSLLLCKLLTVKHPKIVYKIENSFKLRFLALLPDKLQDYIYLKVIK